MLAGTEYCLTYPYLNLSHFQPQQQARFNFDAAVYIIKQAPLINWMQTFPTEEMKNDHVDGYCICKVLVQNSPVLHLQDHAIRPLGACKPGGTPPSVPVDFSSIMGQKLPPSLYYLMLSGIISHKLPQALAKGEWTDKSQPLVDTHQFRELLNDLQEYRKARQNLQTWLKFSFLIAMDRRCCRSTLPMSFILWLRIQGGRGERRGGGEGGGEGRGGRGGQGRGGEGRAGRGEGREGGEEGRAGQGEGRGERKGKRGGHGRERGGERGRGRGEGRGRERGEREGQGGEDFLFPLPLPSPSISVHLSPSSSEVALGLIAQHLHKSFQSKPILCKAFWESSIIRQALGTDSNLPQEAGRGAGVDILGPKNCQEPQDEDSPALNTRNNAVFR